MGIWRHSSRYCISHQWLTSLLLTIMVSASREWGRSLCPSLSWGSLLPPENQYNISWSQRRENIWIENLLKKEVNVGVIIWWYHIKEKAPFFFSFFQAKICRKKEKTNLIKYFLLCKWDGPLYMFFKSVLASLWSKAPVWLSHDLRNSLYWINFVQPWSLYLVPLLCLLSAFFLILYFW